MKLSRKWAAAALVGLGVVTAAAFAQQAATTRITIHADLPGATVNRNIFGQFAEHLGAGIYGGIWVGEDSDIPNTDGYRNDVLEAIRKLKAPVLRWPGGCFADEYHWREGIGPREDRPVKVNTHWGGVTEPNSFGTHEFMNFAEMIGADAYVSGNVGNAPPYEMAEWVEYMTAPAGSLAEQRAANGRDEPWELPYFGIGNELWGCGGNMRAEYAADVTARYATFIKMPQGKDVEKIASGAYGEYLEWTEKMMEIAGDEIDGLGLHYYTVTHDWQKKGSATDFTQEEWDLSLSKTLLMDDHIINHSKVMDKHDPEKRVNLAVDEWGLWHDVERDTNPGFLYQQNTMRDAVAAALNINIFARHAERVRMANIAQMVNVLQAMILTREGDMVLTPTYHVFEMYIPFQDATFLPLDIKTPKYRRDIPMVSASAVKAKDGHVYVALVNTDPEKAAPIRAGLEGMSAQRVTGRVLTGNEMSAHNTFDDPDAVAPKPYSDGTVGDGVLTATLPPMSIVMLQLQ